MGPALLIVCIGIIALIVFFSLKKNQQLTREGKIISRPPNFAENAEIFTLGNTDNQAVFREISSINYDEMSVKMSADGSMQQFRFTGKCWTAKLSQQSCDNSSCVYRFEFTQWKMNDYAPKDALGMNMLLTSVEKAFLRIDGNTTVQNVRLEYRTKHNLI
ncbi:MAG: hypothetical protein IKH21_04960 [Clostridia bacterium]|nr:hypothetical protein [Clostridia bacterium]